MITLRALGGFEVRAPSPDGPGRLGLPPQPSALLVYLALARPLARRTRDHITAMLWPELPEAGARGALNQTVFRLRRALGPEVVTREGEDLRLTNFRCDAVEFEFALDERRLEAALDLYAGDLLAGVYLSQSGEFERWIEEERARLRSRAVAAAVTLATQDERNDNPHGAAGRLRQALAWSPCEEPVARDLVRLLVRCGDRAGAIRAYDAFVSRLEADLGLLPPDDLAQYVRALREGRREPPVTGGLSGQTGAAVTPGAAPDEPASGAAAPPVSAASDDGSVPRRRIPHPIRVALPAGGLLLAAAAAVFLGSRKPATADRVPIVRRITVSSFDNETGDPAKDRLGRLAAERIAEGASGAGLAEVVAGDHGRDGARIVISGSYLQAGDSLLFRARISEAVTGALLTAVVEAAGGGEPPEPAVELLQRRTLGALAPLLDERFASWARVASRPSSLEAYQLYAAGLDRLLGGRSTTEHVGYLLRAAALDSGFTAPLVWALTLSGAAGHFARAESLVRVLEPRRSGLAPWDRAMLDFGVAQLQGNFAEAYAALRRVVELAPESEWELELAFWALWINRPKEAIERLGRLNPDLRLRPYLPRRYWFTLLGARHLSGDFEGVLADVARLRRHHVEEELAVSHELAALAAMGRTAEVNRLASVVLASGDRSAGRLVLDAVMEFRVHGHAQAAEPLLHHLLEWYAALPPQGPPYFPREMHRATALFAAGSLSEAREVFERVVAEMPEGWTVRGFLAQIAARDGNSAAAEREIVWLLGKAGENGGGEAVIHAAAIAAELGDTARAVQIARQAMARKFYYTHPSIHRDPRLEALWSIRSAREMLRPQG